MNDVTIETVIAAAIAVILALFAYKLALDVRVLRASVSLDRAVVTNKSLAFQFESGIDIQGKAVVPWPPAEAQRTIVFLLHGRSIARDIAFWKSVKALRANETVLRLVGYCDDSQCVEYLQTSAKDLDFPVIAYGELISGQALVNSDFQGYSLVRSEGWLLPRQVSWRKPSDTPSNVIREAVQ